jgi:hypothetical protein
MTRGTRARVAALITTLLTIPLLTASPPSAAGPVPASASTAERAVSWLPGGGQTVFGKQRFLTAYYGTAGTGSLGVLGETDPDRAFQRISRAGGRFLRGKERLLPVYELIVTVADGEDHPGTDGDHAHDVLHSRVQSYIDAAHRNGALLVLDLQPGRSDFLTVAKRWEWALQDPWVGLALDPEWRVGPAEFPGQTIGSVSAREINRTAGWLARLTRDHGLPEKLFVIHQFTHGMVPDIRKVRHREGLAMVQHIDGFGNPADKMMTYHGVAVPRKFTMGFKIFYDEDVPRMRAGQVRRSLPDVRFVSFQ